MAVEVGYLLNRNGVSFTGEAGLQRDTSRLRTENAALKTKPEGRGLADIHIHTRVSDGMADIMELVDFVERETRLDVIAITDHDQIEGGYRARELAAKNNCRFEVVVGMDAGFYGCEHNSNRRKDAHRQRSDQPYQ